MTQPGLFALLPFRYPTLDLSFWRLGLSPKGDVGAPCQGPPGAREGGG